MLRASRSALLLTTVSLTAGLFAVPGVAYAADTTTSLTQTQMATELKKVAGTSTAATKQGWKAALSGTGDFSDMSASYVVDTPRGRAVEHARTENTVETAYAVAGRGVYRSLNDAASLSAVKMMSRPTVRYVFTAQPSLNLDTYLKDRAPTPATVLTDDIQAGTKTTHDDGSTDYTFLQDSLRFTMHVDRSGILNTASISHKEFSVKLAYAYGPQQVTPPAPAVTVGSVTMNRALAYLDMRGHVAQAANQGAADARRAARGHTVKVSSLRKLVRKNATAVNAEIRVQMVKVANVRGGVRLYATNPWTGKTVSYTVKASGKKVTVRG